MILSVALSMALSVSPMNLPLTLKVDTLHECMAPGIVLIQVAKLLLEWTHSEHPMQIHLSLLQVIMLLTWPLLCHSNAASICMQWLMSTAAVPHHNAAVAAMSQHSWLPLLRWGFWILQ